MCIDNVWSKLLDKENVKMNKLIKTENILKEILWGYQTIKDANCRSVLNARACRRVSSLVAGIKANENMLREFD